MSAGNLHLAWARLFVRAAAAAGVRRAVLSPGSRSTPLAIALAEEQAIALTVIVDERSAAFFALGEARITAAPSLLVCTSGTAGAHWYPAIIEASQSFVPMLAVTADRPWEAYDAMASQTVDQAKMFGGFVRHFAEVGLPDASPAALRAVPRIAAQAVARSLGPTPGPVHLNLRFRKPLEPVEVAGPEPWEPIVDAIAARGAPAVYAPLRMPDPTATSLLAEQIARAERGVIVAGPSPIAAAADREALLALARKTGFPLLAEATSQLRFGGDRAGVIDTGAFELLLRDKGFRARHAPDLALLLGAPPTSSGCAAWLAESGARRVVIAPHGWNDPDSDASALMLAEPAAVARALLDRLPARGASPWSRAFTRAAALVAPVVEAAIAEAASAAPDLGEGAIARSVVASCPEDTILVAGNSTPVRDLDLYCPPSGRALRVLHQRGASGIDGLTSGAAGAHAASGAPTCLLLGDLSLLHDLGGLAQLAKAKGPLVVVVVQNGGGRIFDQLPIARRADPALLERVFTTPEPVRFEAAAAAFGVRYARAETRAQLDRALAAAWSSPGATLVEAVAAPREGARALSRMQAEVSTIIERDQP